MFEKEMHNERLVSLYIEEGWCCYCCRGERVMPCTAYRKKKQIKVFYTLKLYI
jgi:hypothetical protein